MRELPEHQVPATFAVFFGQELRRYRTAADLSQDQLGAEVNYTGTYVGLIEAAKRSCPRDLAERADELLDARGALLNLWAQANQEPHPAWFQPFVKAESEAASISEFEPLVVSGLLAHPRRGRAAPGHRRPQGHVRRFDGRRGGREAAPHNSAGVAVQCRRPRRLGRNLDSARRQAQDGLLRRARYRPADQRPR